MTRKFRFIGIPLLMLLTIVSHTAVAQGDPPVIADYSYSEWRFAIAKWQINSLQSGVLLVRLKSNQSAIDQLRAAGNTAYADRIEQEQKKDNAELIDAFRSVFDFCDVYFFKSEDSDLVRKHKLDSINYVAKILLNPEAADLNSATSFLVAELALLAPDTTKRKDYNHPQVKKSNNAVSYNAGSNLRIPVLVFKSDQFVQLSRPFPYYVRTYKSIDFLVQKPMYRVVSQANVRLHDFYGSRLTFAARPKDPYKVAKKKEYADSDIPKSTFAFYGSYSIRTAKNIAAVGDGSGYLKQLKRGFGLGADMNFFFSKNYGWGLRYLFNQYSAEDSDLEQEEDITIHYVGPQFTTRLIGSNERDVFYVSVGIGYNWYKDRVDFEQVKSTIKAERIGLSFDVAYDYDLSKRVAVTLQLGLTTGYYEAFSLKEDGAKSQNISFPNGGGDNLVRMEFKAGFRLK